MPDGDASRIIYAPAKRKNVGALIMLAGPAGSGKTYSALKLAKGLAGSDGRVAFCDSENERGLYYANEFEFSLYYSLSEPFRPSRFEAAAVAAQQQGATVWICDSFSAEHSGPGGLLDFHESELQRMAGDDYNKRERMKAAAWIKPKMEHKHMLQRLWQLNMHVILCCQAERKTALQKIESGPKRGKIEFVDLGYQPVCGNDIPYAMTMSFLFDVSRPGVPIVIKPLLEELVPIIELTKPISQETGARIAAWARGDSVVTRSPETRGRESARTEHPVNADAPPEGAKTPGRWRTVSEGDVLNPGFSASMNVTTGVNRVWEPEGENAFASRRQPDETEIEAGAKAIAEQFRGTADLRAHRRLLDDPELSKRREWLQKNRNELFQREVLPAIQESWKRTSQPPAPKPEPPAPPAEPPNSEHPE